MPEERLYTEEEVAAILRDAELQKDGATRSEVLAAAEEAGLDTRKVSAVMDRRPSPESSSSDAKGASVVLDFPVKADQLSLALTELPTVAHIRAKHTGLHLATSFEKGATVINVEVFSDASTTTVRVWRSNWQSVIALMVLSTLAAGMFTLFEVMSRTTSNLGFIGVTWLAVQALLLAMGFVKEKDQDTKLAQKIAARLRRTADSA